LIVPGVQKALVRRTSIVKVVSMPCGHHVVSAIQVLILGHKRKDQTAAHSPLPHPVAAALKGELGEPE
jgi:hypothetical protein